MKYIFLFLSLMIQSSLGQNEPKLNPKAIEEILIKLEKVTLSEEFDVRDQDVAYSLAFSKYFKQAKGVTGIDAQMGLKRAYLVKLPYSIENFSKKEELLWSIEIGTGLVQKKTNAIALVNPMSKNVIFVMAPWLEEEPDKK